MKRVGINRVGKKPIYRFKVENRYWLGLRIPDRFFESKKNAKKYIDRLNSK
jgi:hypothetical protein